MTKIDANSSVNLLCPLYCIEIKIIVLVWLLGIL